MKGRGCSGVGELKNLAALGLVDGVTFLRPRAEGDWDDEPRPADREVKAHARERIDQVEVRWHPDRASDRDGGIGADGNSFAGHLSEPSRFARCAERLARISHRAYGKRLPLLA